MHIPDGFLSPEVAATTGVISAGAVAYGVRRAGERLDERRVPLLGVTAAFVFAAQMLNFPVAGGTSGHFLGAALAAVLLGPWLACVVLAVVLAVQAFMFADGGITALGANVLDMGVIGGLGVGSLMLLARNLLPRTRATLLGIAATGAWLAVMAGAAGCGVELALSDTVPLGTVLPAMLGVHALIGIGEAVVTVAAVAAVLATRPDLLGESGFGVPDAAPGAGGVVSRAFVVLALAVAVGLATAASPFASSSPDGLERVAGDKGFVGDGKLHSIQEDSPIPDYAFPGIDDERVATGLAGFVGTLVAFGVGWGIAVLARGRGRPPADQPPAAAA